MADETADQRWQRGRRMLQKVYAGVVPAPQQPGASPFADLMLRQLFAEVWSREDVLSIRERRLLLFGAICALGEGATFQIQARAALKNGELNAAQLREILITMAQYAGYPRVAALIAPLEQLLAEHEKAAAVEADSAQ